MANPYMTKERVRDMMTIIDSLVHYLSAFINSDGGDFYDKIEYSTNASEGEPEQYDRADMIDNIIKHNIVKLDMFNYEFIPYLKSQPSSYVSFVKSELLPQVMTVIKPVLECEGIEVKIYQYEDDSDFMHDIYLVLKGAYLLFTHLDAILAGEENDTNFALNYRLSFLGSYLDDEDDASKPVAQPLPTAFTWLGTPAELACMMSTLNENGYIEAPKRTNGERNNEGFSRMICSHFRLADGSEKSVLNNLKDSRITPDNQFQIAMNKLPKRR